MDAAHAHVLVNQFPVVLTLLALAGLLVAMLTRKPFYWLFGMLCAVLAGIAVIPAFFTGRAARRIMEQVWFVSRTVVDAHEEAAEFAVWVTLASGVASAYALWRLARVAREDGDALPYWMRATVGVLAVAAAAAVARTAFEGRRIVHDAPALNGPTAPSAAPTR
jgi:hypothetical protein